MFSNNHACKILDPILYIFLVSKILTHCDIAFARFDHGHTILVLHHLYNVQVMQQQYCMSLQCTFEVLKVRLGLGIIVLTFFGQWDIKNCLTLTSNVRAVCWRKLISQNHLGAPINWGRKIIIQYFGKEWRERALIKIGFVCHKKDFKMDWEHLIYRDSC